MNQQCVVISKKYAFSVNTIPNEIYVSFFPMSVSLYFSASSSFVASLLKRPSRRPNFTYYSQSSHFK